MGMFDNVYNKKYKKLVDQKHKMETYLHRKLR